MDLWHFGTDTDPNPWIYTSDYRIRILLFRQWPSKRFFVYYPRCFLRVHLHHSSQIKSQKEVTKQWKSRFSLLFLFVIEGSGSVSLTTGSRWLKNTVCNVNTWASTSTEMTVTQQVECIHLAWASTSAICLSLSATCCLSASVSASAVESLRS